MQGLIEHYRFGPVQAEVNYTWVLCTYVTFCGDDSLHQGKNTI